MISHRRSSFSMGKVYVSSMYTFPQVYFLWYNSSEIKRIVNRIIGGIKRLNQKLKSPMHDQLFKAILSLETMEECYDFFEDICTIGELKSISQRLEVAKLLKAGTGYDQIVELTGASTATISRVKRCLNYGADGYNKILPRIKE